MKGVPEFAPENVKNIFDILNPEGIIQAEGIPKMLDIFRGHFRVDDHRRGIARRQPEENKEKRDNDKERYNNLYCSSQDILL